MYNDYRKGATHLPFHISSHLLGKIIMWLHRIPTEVLCCQGTLQEEWSTVTASRKWNNNPTVINQAIYSCNESWQHTELLMSTESMITWKTVLPNESLSLCANLCNTLSSPSTFTRVQKSVGFVRILASIASSRCTFFSSGVRLGRRVLFLAASGITSWEYKSFATVRGSMIAIRRSFRCFLNACTAAATFMLPVTGQMERENQLTWTVTQVPPCKFGSPLASYIHPLVFMAHQ